MGKTKIEARDEKVKTDFHISLPRYMAREVERIRVARDIKTAEFFRCLYDQAKAARVPLLSESNN